jgi:hypothetical protein
MNPVVSTASNELCSEARGRLVERLDGPIGTGEHHAALKRGHDMKGSRFRGRAPDPMRKIINAATEKGLDFFSDFGRQNAGLGAQDAKEAHLTILIESRSKRRSVGGYSVSGALVGLTRHAAKKRSPYRRATAAAMLALVGKW